MDVYFRRDDERDKEKRENTNLQLFKFILHPVVDCKVIFLKEVGF